MINDGENCWPSREQGLLLRAGLLKNRQALEAWQEWRSIIDIDDHLDDGSYRLLPLLYQNLKNHGVEDPFMNRLKGIYRLTWYKNQMLFHRNARLLNALRNSGIETLVLKGGALVPLYYKDYGIRPMADFDVLVHTDKVLQSIDLLEKSGWIPKDFKPSEKYISQRYSHGFIDDEGKEFDLHWHVLSECCSPDSDDDFWEGAISTEINGVSAYALNPTDQLLHVCVHGMKWDVVPTIRWISDAMIILNNTQIDIDWDRLIAQARKAFKEASKEGNKLATYKPALTTVSSGESERDWVERIRHALNNHDFYTVQQSIVDLEGENEGLFENSTFMREEEGDTPATEFRAPSPPRLVRAALW